MFQMGQFEVAKVAFEEATKLGNAKSELWFRKCNAELAYGGHLCTM